MGSGLGAYLTQDLAVAEQSGPPPNEPMTWLLRMGVARRTIMNGNQHDKPIALRDYLARDAERASQHARCIVLDEDGEIVGFDPIAREAAYHLVGCALAYYLLGLDPAAAAKADADSGWEPDDLARDPWIEQGSLRLSLELRNPAVTSNARQGGDRT